MVGWVGMSASGGYLVERHVGFVTIYLEYQSSLVPVAAVRTDMKKMKNRFYFVHRELIIIFAIIASG